ncbi:LysE family translocator [Stutzerimonas zhaodongensis]|jgi:threonine/homoserine/homoserine lactone efflux protein|uniref:LysE family translocator n=1 Tax=Stutzerimonas zhaodongensis TaxID=1176257 RepID=A0A365PRV3_9GAMM|nr:LysE family translocator [Stutzerimonas zhaodongensis]QWV15729.1 LysE family translocator [Stutzerimonas zhaodongensis]RBA54979.1 LysE family translocator [Stutzerimonas zhaodongensis]
MSLSLSMAAFALASSISPGPVNIVALSAGAQFGLRPAMRHVSGATIGFTLLLLLIGLGLNELLGQWPWLAESIKLAGVAFLLYMAFRLAADDGRLNAEKPAMRPTMLYGATMQWLNPKAWLASVAGMGLFAAAGDAPSVWRFAAIYFVICYASLACWAYAGTFLRQHLNKPARVRLFNRSMAALLVASAAYLLLT